jgi:hypothetical protein
MVDTPFSDSYIATDSELETLIGGDKRASAVALKAASAADQAWYCQEATRHIDAVPLRGRRYEGQYIENGSQKDINSDGLTQTLEFPRIIDDVIVDYDHGTQLPIVPDLVKRACLEEAIAIYDFGSSWRRKNQEQGVKQVQLGSGSGLSESYLTPTTMLSFRARQIMRRYVGATIR